MISTSLKEVRGTQALHPGLGTQALFEDFERSISVLLNNPELGAARRYGKRHYDLKRFPYSVVYTISGQEVRIPAVAHQSRRPGYWRRRK